MEISTTWKSRLTALAGAALLVLAFGCAKERGALQPLGQSSFAEYRSETCEWIAQNRHFQSHDHAQELEWNAPQEYRPAGKYTTGILLVHGLGDSPWTFVDVGKVLAENGILARTVLLPGFGTKPADLIDVRVEDWRQVVAEQAAIMSAEVESFYLGGFSTGANLAIEYADRHPEVKGLLLFSPAIYLNFKMDFLSPVIARVAEWPFTPPPGMPTQSPMRYYWLPTNAFAQFYYTRASAADLLNKRPFKKPALLVLSENDSVLDTTRIMNEFDTLFPHPASRVLWYGDEAKTLPLSHRVQAKPAHLPLWRISNFSHMGIMFSPHNPQYGFHGTERIYFNGITGSPRVPDSDLWFSAWGFHEKGRTHARLTFNPHFDWQNKLMLSILTQAEQSP